MLSQKIRILAHTYKMSKTLQLTIFAPNKFAEKVRKSHGKLRHLYVISFLCANCHQKVTFIPCNDMTLTLNKIKSNRLSMYSILKHNLLIHHNSFVELANILRERHSRHLASMF